MIHNQLRDIGLINAFRSDRVLYALVEELAAPHVSSQSGYLDEVKSSIRDFYPSRFRKDAIEYVYETDAKEPMETLDRLYDEYLAGGRDGSYVFADIKKLERYSALINKIHPFTILGRRLAKEWKSGLCDFRTVVEVAQVVTPLLLGAHRDARVYSDNHIHLGGANENLPNLLVLFERDTPQEYYDKKWHSTKLPRLSEFSLINSGKLTIGHLIDIGKCAMNYLHAVVNTEDAEEEARARRSTAISMSAILKNGKVAATSLEVANIFSMSTAYSYFKKTPEGRVLYEVVKAAEEKRRVEQWLYYNVLLHRLYLLHASDSVVRNMVMIVFHVTNIIRSYQIMSQNVGLSHFSEFYGSKVRQTYKARHGAIAENIFRNGTTEVEGKIGPGQIYNSEMMRYKLEFDDEILKAECEAKPTAYERAFVNTLDHSIARRYHFSIHFRRESDRKRDKSEGTGLCASRHQSLRKKLKKEALRLHRYLYEDNTRQTLFSAYRGAIGTGKQLLNLLRYEKQLSERWIDPAMLIVSLDVAGKETAAPPEVYAPVVNFLRSEPKRSRMNAMTLLHSLDVVPHRKLRLSMHAGEDFDHIATGMRRIDETIEFYGMHAHDRLGHALAAGIDPKQWMRRNGDVFMRTIDRLDDLVWLYRQVGYILPHLPEAASFLHRSKGVIERLSKQIYTKTYTPEELYEAWELRKYCPIESAETVPNKGIDLYYNSADLKCSDDKKQACGLFKDYHTKESVRERGDEVLRLTYEKNADEFMSKIDDFELEVLEAVQDWLLQKIAERGIIIEANPSSNVYIAQLEHFSEHPIFRWDPVNGFDEEEEKKYNRFSIRKGRVKVCVNTDDPAIFPTTLFTEFKHLKRAAIDDLGYHRPSVEQWQKRVRELGTEIFDYDHQRFEFLPD